MIKLTEAQRAKLRWIFTGPDGIRAGWSVLIFIGIFAISALLIHFVVKDLLHHTPSLPKPGEALPPGKMLLQEAVSTVFVLGVTAIMGRIEGKPFWAYGLGGTRPVSKFWVGWAGGLVCLSLLVGALNIGGYLVFDGVALHGVQVISYALVWSLGFFLVGLSEETMFRGYLQSTLTRGIGFWPAALVMSGLFGLAHTQNPGENPAGIVGVVVAGLIFCWLLRASGSLWLGIGFHTAWDWAQSYFYGTPDSGLMMQGHLLLTHAAGKPFFSGGSAGPEGSVLGMPALVLGLLALSVAARRAGLFTRSA